MKARLGISCIIPILFALLASHGMAQTAQAAKDKDLPNFHQVNEHLYRGAQPSINGLRKLASMGIKTILNLRGESKLSKDEMEVARVAGLRYMSVPMAELSRPTDEQINSALGIINDKQNWPVFVHCKHGEDRTGVVIACYRISQDGKTDKEALREAKQFGMNWVQFGMKDYIQDYYKRKVRLRSQSVLRRVSDEVNLAW